MTPSERLPKESALCYRRFIYWVELGDKRSLGLVAKRFRISRKMAEKMSSNHKWAARLRTMQIEEQDRKAEADLRAKEVFAIEREKRKNMVEETGWELFQEFSKKVREMLKFPVQRAVAINDDGKTFNVFPAKWDFASMAKLAQVGDQLARMGLGMPIGRAEVTGADGKPLENTARPAVIEIKYLSDEESKKLIESARPIITEKDE